VPDAVTFDFGEQYAQVGADGEVGEHVQAAPVGTVIGVAAQMSVR